MEIHTAENSPTKLCTVLYKVHHYIVTQISAHFVNYTDPASFLSIQTAIFWSVTRGSIYNLEVKPKFLRQLERFRAYGAGERGILKERQVEL